MMRSLFCIFLTRIAAITLIVSVSGCISYPNQGNETRLELPSYCENDCIIRYTGYTISYDKASRIPIWVAYELTREEANDTTFSRKGKSFRQDDKAKVIQADNNDYRSSDWSRGHMAPAGDFRWNDQALWDTFYYTNCCPQDTNLNSGSWNVLENKVRKWANEFGNVYVVTGPIIGKNQNGKIGSHGVVVPDAFFKAVLVYTNDSYHGIAFVMFNKSEKQRLSDSYLSINKLEKLMDIDFFPSLDDSIEEVIEDTVDLRLWKIR